MSLLAQTHPAKNDWFRTFLDGYQQAGSGSPAGLLLLAVLALSIGGLWCFARWYRLRRAEPTAPELLGRFAGQLGLTRADRQLLARLARAAQLEPAVVLVAPALLGELLARCQRQGVPLSARQSARLGHIRDVVTAAAAPAEG